MTLGSYDGCRGFTDTRMHPVWRTFIQQQAAQSAQAEPPVAHLVDLSDTGVIACSGADARTFLQDQISTDIHALNPAVSQLSSWSNAKGRIVTMLRIFQRDDAIYLALPQLLLAPVLKRLGLYVLRAKVKLVEAGGIFASFGLMGDDAPDLLYACKLPLPLATNEVSNLDDVQIIRLHGNQPRFFVYGTAEKLMPLWETLAAKGGYQTGKDAWILHRILAREPEIHPETSEHFVAQMLGLEELGAVNFRKGCYLGQEVIARAHYRGAVKRHLHRASCETPTRPEPGMPIHVQGSDQIAAELVDAARDPQGRWQMLLVVQDEFVGAPLHLNQAPVTLLP